MARDDNGVLVPDPVGFPDGIEPLASYVHAPGFKFGICKGAPCFVHTVFPDYPEASQQAAQVGILLCSYRCIASPRGTLSPEALHQLHKHQA